MIVRIMADNQYRIGEGEEAEIARLDDELLAALDANDDGRFRAALAELVRHVQQQGEVVPDEEVVPSDLMIPAPDMTLAEAREKLHKGTDTGGEPAQGS